MKIEDLINKWDASPPSDTSFSRVDDSHILDIFIGKDSESHRELMVISDIEPAKINSSKALDIQKGVRADGRWATVIKLVMSEETEVFTHLCWDLIEKSRNALTKTLGLELFIARFLKWQKLLESRRNLLSEEKIRGIIGELLYAREYLSIKMGWDTTFSSWLGPEGSDKDYVFDDTWIEVKTIKPGKPFITISSFEQLTSDKLGCLAVVILENTSTSDNDGFSFAELINEIRGALDSNPSALFTYETKLIELGYTERKEYYDKHYVHRHTYRFLVDEEFPKLLKDDIPTAIINARYDISLSDIMQYEMEND